MKKNRAQTSEVIDLKDVKIEKVVEIEKKP